MAAATVNDVATSLGRPITSDGETAQVELWLDDAGLQIRLRLGDLDLLDQEALAYVEREAVVAKIRNPEGKQSESIDDYTYRRTENAARGQVFISDEWWDLLTPDQATGAFSILAAGDPYIGYTSGSRDTAWDL